MKLKQLFLIFLTLESASPIYPSDLAIIMNASTTDLMQAQSNLQNILNTMPSTQNVDTQTTTPPAMQNQSNITNPIDTKLSVSTGAIYSYKNTTNIPLILAITEGNMVNQQQVAPGATYTQTLNSSSNVTVEAHANLSGISTACNPAASYNLTIDAQNQLALKQTSIQNSTITNTTSWPMLISIKLSNNSYNYISLEDGNQYQLPASTTYIIAVPLIPNIKSSSDIVTSCTISNQKGQLNLQF